MRRSLIRVAITFAICLISASVGPKAQAQIDLGGFLGRLLVPPPSQSPPPVQHHYVPPAPPATPSYRPPPPARAPALALPDGMSRDEVVELQNLLIDLGYLRGTADGIVGPMTRRAITQMQAMEGLPVDGVPSQGALRQARVAARREHRQTPGARPANTDGSFGQRGDGLAASGEKPAPASSAAPNMPSVVDAGTADEPRLGARRSEPLTSTPIGELRVGRARSDATVVAQALMRFWLGTYPDRLQDDTTAILAAATLLPDQAAPFFANVGRTTRWQLWAGNNEFARMRAQQAFRAEIVPRLRDLAAREPVTLSLVGIATLAQWNAANRQMPFSYVLPVSGVRGAESLSLPLGVPGLSQRALPVSLPQPLPSAINADASEAERILSAADPQRRLWFKVDLRIETAQVELDRPTWDNEQFAFVGTVLGQGLYADEALTERVVDLPVTRPVAPTRPGISEAAQDAPLAFGVSQELDRENALKLTRALLSADPAALAEPEALKYAITSLLVRDRARRYVAFNPRSNHWGDWVGQDQFARAETVRRAQVDAVREIVEGAPRLPIEVVTLTQATLSRYDAALRGFPLQLVQGTGISLAMPPQIRFDLVEDRSTPRILPVEEREAATLYRSLAAQPGEQRTVHLLRRMRLHEPTIQAGRSSSASRRAIAAEVLEQTFFADATLQQSIVEDAALRAAAPERDLLAAFAAEVASPTEPLRDSHDTRALLRLKAGAPYVMGQSGLVGSWLQAHLQESRVQGFPWSSPLLDPSVQSFLQRRPEGGPIEHAFMRWNRRRVAAMPDVFVHRHQVSGQVRDGQKLRLALFSNSFRQPDAVPDQERERGDAIAFRLAPGSARVIEIAPDVAMRLVRNGISSFDIETRLRVAALHYEAGLVTVDVAILGATALGGGHPVAGIGDTPIAEAASQAEAAAERLAILDLRPGSNWADAVRVSARELGEDVDHYSLATRPRHAPGVLPRLGHGRQIVRRDGTDSITWFAARGEGEVLALMRVWRPAGGLPAAAVISGLEQRYGPPDQRSGQVGAGVTREGGIVFGWSTGPLAGGIAALPRERAACISPWTSFATEPAIWQADAPAGFGRPRGVEGLAPRDITPNLGAACGPTLVVRVTGQGDRVETVTMLLAEPVRALAATPQPATVRASAIATDVPDIVGVRLGSSAEAAVAAISSHLTGAREVTAARRATANPAQFAPYGNARLFLAPDGGEAIAIYHEPPAAADTVVALWRRVRVAPGVSDPAGLFAGLIAKYGEPSARRESSLWWGTTSDGPGGCGDLSPSGFGRDSILAGDPTVLPRAGHDRRQNAIELPTPTSSLAHFVNEQGMPAALQCRPHLGARIAVDQQTQEIFVDQWALDEGGYFPLLLAGRAAIAPPQVGARPPNASSADAAAPPTIRF